MYQRFNTFPLEISSNLLAKRLRQTIHNIAYCFPALWSYNTYMRAAAGIISLDDTLPNISYDYLFTEMKMFFQQQYSYTQEVNCRIYILPTSTLHEVRKIIAKTM